MDMVPNCVSEKAHAGDEHDGRNHLLFSIDILGCARSVLDIVVPVTGSGFFRYRKQRRIDRSGNGSEDQQSLHQASGTSSFPAR